MTVTLKLATSLDGRIATASGESRWITGPEARAEVHRLRAAHDAVLVGVETALADNPELTVRLDGYDGRQPARVVLDSRQRLPAGSKLAETARTVPTFLVSPTALRADLAALGVRGITASPRDLQAVLSELAALGLTRIFVEGGGQVAASFLAAGLADFVEWFRAPLVLGENGRPSVAAVALGALAEAPRLRRLDVRPVGDDLWERYERI